MPESPGTAEEPARERAELSGTFGPFAAPHRDRAGGSVRTRRTDVLGLWLGMAYVTAPIFGLLGAGVAVIGVVGALVPSYPERFSPAATALGLMVGVAGFGLYWWIIRAADKHRP